MNLDVPRQIRSCHFGGHELDYGQTRRMWVQTESVLFARCVACDTWVKITDERENDE